jgi:hypothetical protein
MNAFKTILEPGDDLQVTLPEEFRNKKVEVIVLEVEEQRPSTPDAKGKLNLATMPLGGMPFNREDCYDDDRIKF